MVFNMEVSNMQEVIYNRRISITIYETTDACGRAAVNVLFSFGDKTKLVKTEYLVILLLLN
jgi:hypothetical protein